MWNKQLKSAALIARAKSAFAEEIMEEQSRLVDASEEENLEEIKDLLSSGMLDVDCVVGTYTHSGYITPLQVSAQCGNSDAVQILLDKGADPDKAELDEYGPLHMAALMGYKDVVKMLLDAGANPNKEAGEGNTALLVAAEKECKEVAKVLLEGGADPNVAQVDNGRWTALHHAAYEGDIEMVQLLVDYGADPDAEDENGETALHFARDMEHCAVIGLLNNLGSWRIQKCSCCN